MEIHRIDITDGGPVSQCGNPPYTLEKLEARGGIEPPIKVLQTFALPLGDRAQAFGKISLTRSSPKLPDMFQAGFTPH